MANVIGELVYLKAILMKVFGKRAEKLPTVVVTDSRNLFQTVHSTSLTEDTRLITDVAAIKESLESGEVTKIKWVSGENMLADCLTKAGAPGTSLLRVMKTGKYLIPEDWK